MRIDVPGTGRPLARRLRRAAVACLLLAVVVAVGSWNGLLLIVARHVIPGWVVGSTLIVATLLLRLVGATWRRGERPSGRQPERPTTRAVGPEVWGRDHLKFIRAGRGVQVGPDRLDT